MLKIFILASLLLSGCATQAPVLKITNSGYAEGVFLRESSNNVRSKILDSCMSKGLIISEASDYKIVCEKKLAGGLGAMIVGDPASTTAPMTKVAFMVLQIHDDVRVTASMWNEFTNRHGRVKKYDITSVQARNNVQKMLFDLGAK